MELGALFQALVESFMKVHVAFEEIPSSINLVIDLELLLDVDFFLFQTSSRFLVGSSTYSLFMFSFSDSILFLKKMLNKLATL